MGRHQAVNWDKYPGAIELIIKLRNEGNSYSKIAERLNDGDGFSVNEHMVKRAYNKYSGKAKSKKEFIQQSVTEEVVEEIDEDLSYKESHSIEKDGTHKSDKLLRMTEEQKKDPLYMLQAHGFDPDEWDLVNVRNNIWNTYSKQDGINTLYSSKLTAKPKVDGFNWNKLIDIVKNPPKVHIDSEYQEEGELYLNIPLFDMHYGISDYNHYKMTQLKILKILDTHHKEVLFIIGSDLFHHNDHRNRTASGREIEHADMTIAWEDAVKFYEPIINKALRTSKKVSGMFIKGNHSESLEWAFTKYLEGRYPQIKFDTRFVERKVHVMGSIFIGSTHGDKNKISKLNELFSTEFPLEWARTKTREVYTGHEHHEKVEDKGGLVIRQLSTRNKTDKWHEDFGYTSSHKRFQVFQYSKEELENIYLV